MLLVQKVQEETNLLKRMMENLGFSLISSTSKSIKQILNEEFIDELFGVYITDDRVGSCTIINAFNGTIIEITLDVNTFTIPKDTVKQLQLLGFKEHVKDELIVYECESRSWLEYRVEIHD